MSTARLRMVSAALLVAVGAPLLAQSNPAAPAQASNTVTLVGCLVQGPVTKSMADRAEADRPGADDFYVRTPTVAVPVGATVAVGKPGTTSTATSAGTPTTDTFYRVTGLDPSQLRPHLDHRVEVHGELTESGKSDASTAKTTVDSTGRATTQVETRPVVAGSVNAKTIKMLGASCS